MSLNLIPYNTKIDFIRLRRLCYALSLLVIGFGLFSLFIKGGPLYGIDFAGGTVIQIKLDKNIPATDLTQALDNLNLSGLVVQQFGMKDDNEYLIRISSSASNTDELRSNITKAFAEKLQGIAITIQRVEMVGPKVGGDLRNSAIEALYFASLLIVIYVSGRFEHRWFTAGFMALALASVLYILPNIFENIPYSYMIIVATIVTCFLAWKLKLIYALGAIVGLIHDVIVTLGLLSILNIQIDLIIITAILTIIGYSLNDTIVVYDRIRETLKNNKNIDNYAEIINLSVNQTLSRTILTSFTTLLVVICLFLFGGGIIHNFALTMLIGIVAGTYSTIFVSSPILLAFGKPPVEEEQKEKINKFKSPDGAVV